ncbi:hypothetical protein [Nocardia sp. NPDC049526]|uniref:hypothetical protein n=1 Tax=Nocardia sp. NPDC049526 TaxID=3364316 RepID=UPI0037A2A9E3
MTPALTDTIRPETSDSTPAHLRHRNLAPLFGPSTTESSGRTTAMPDLAVAVVSGDGLARVTHTVRTADFATPPAEFPAYAAHHRILAAIY